MATIVDGREASRRARGVLVARENREERRNEGSSASGLLPRSSRSVKMRTMSSTHAHRDFSLEIVVLFVQSFDETAPTHAIYLVQVPLEKVVEGCSVDLVDVAFRESVQR